VPFFFIGIVHEGISPEDAERLLVMPMEIELRKVEGVKELTAYASEGSANMLVEFDADYDLDQALLDVREAVDRAKPELPSTAEEPFVREETTDDFPSSRSTWWATTCRSACSTTSPSSCATTSRPSQRARSRAAGPSRGTARGRHRPLRAGGLPHLQRGADQTIVRNNRLIPAGSIDTGQGRFCGQGAQHHRGSADIFDLPIRAAATPW
jgi:multidrug efflux pump